MDKLLLPVPGFAPVLFWSDGSKAQFGSLGVMTGSHEWKVKEEAELRKVRDLRIWMSMLGFDHHT